MKVIVKLALAAIALLVILAITVYGDFNGATSPSFADTPPPMVSEPATRSVVEDPSPQTDQAPAAESDTAQPGPVEVFSRVEVFDGEYRGASQQAGAMLARMTNPPVLRSQILLRDQGLVSEFIRQVTSGGLTQAFDLSPFPDDTCTVSSIDYTAPRLTPGASVPNLFLVYSYCDSSGKLSTVQVNMSERSVSFFMTYGVKSYTLSPIGDSKYSIAFESHYEMPGPGARRPDSFSIPRND